MKQCTDELIYLDTKINQETNLVVYGFNDVGEELYTKYKDRIVGVIDNNKVGQIVDDLIIQSVDEFKFNNNVFIIAVVNYLAYTEIKSDLKCRFGKDTLVYSINDYYFDEEVGLNFYCPICKVSSNFFKLFGLNPRKNARCPSCNSLERHRLSWPYLKDNFINPEGNKKLLHFAPEAIFKSAFSEIFAENYFTADLFRTDVRLQIDITNIPLEDNSFDYIYCSHVLEHVIDDRKAMKEMHRLLNKDGLAVMLVPLSAKDKTEEDFSVTCPEERTRLYGQHDHVRNYGMDFVDRLEEAGFTVEVITPQNLFSNEDIARMNPRGELFVCRK